ncbi:hypothetical protein KIPB_011289, partial [Kipferlia bialata]
FLDPERLRVGDVILLRVGTAVPADCRVLPWECVTADTYSGLRPAAEQAAVVLFPFSGIPYVPRYLATSDCRETDCAQRPLSAYRTPRALDTVTGEKERERERAEEAKRVAAHSFPLSLGLLRRRAPPSAPLAPPQFTCVAGSMVQSITNASKFTVGVNNTLIGALAVVTATGIIRMHR